MVLLHTAGICFPMFVKRFLTNVALITSILLLWILPLVSLISVFTSFPDKMFLSPSCSDVSTLQTFSFRAYFTSAIFIPVLVILVTYSYFYVILHQRMNLSGSSQVIQRQN